MTKMNRLKMLEKARQLAYEVLDSNIALSDKSFAELKKLDGEKAIRQLAKEFLQDAFEDFDAYWE